jgi:cobyrinic acid a,c-diamide synthase
MGLFDGPRGAPGSTADLAAELNLPVVLVVDASHQAQSIAALVHGFTTFRKNLNIAGVILNRVKSDRHAQLLTECLGDTNVLGIVRHNDSLALPSRHLGLVQAQEIQQLEIRIEEIAQAVARETVIDKLLQIGASFSNQTSPSAQTPLGQHIAIAQDAAFSFIYPHLLDAWRQAGAKLSFFSPLENEAPSLVADAVYLPGGYPELHAGKLSGNTKFLSGLQKSRALIFGECGGYMVLGNALIDAAGHAHKMAGLLSVTTSFQKRKLSLGYRELSPLTGPWTTKLRGHEFHYSTIAATGADEPLFAAKDPAGNELGQIGHRRGNVMGSYAHIISELP